MRRGRIPLLVATALLVAGIAGGGARANGVAFAVDTTADAHDVAPGDGVCATSGGDCSLRAAIEEADALSGTDSISVPAGTYVLDAGGGTELQIASPDGVTVTGAGSGSTDVEAGGTNVFLPGQGATDVLRLAAGAKATLADLEISQGGGNLGGGIASAGDLTLDAVDLDHNQASNYGGAIDQTAGSLTMTGGSVTANVAHGNFGGGIAIDGGTATLTGTTVSGNQVGFSGGGIYSIGTLTLTDVDVDGNSATGSNEGAGGVDGGGTTTISGGTFDGNTTNGTGKGGGIHVGGSGTIGGAEIDGNTAGSGGGVEVDGTLSITGSTVDGNHAVAAGSGVGGGIDDEGTLTLSTSSVTNDSADGGGGGIIATDAASLTNDTIAGNSNGGLVNTGTVTMLSTTVSNNTSGGVVNQSGQIDLTDTIVAKQQSGADCSNAATIVSHGHNLDSDGTCDLTGTGDQTGVDPLLGTLADNGGPTKTLALQSGSPAIDGGDGSACPATDQRGVSRSGVCDVGAYEFASPPPPPPPPPPPSGSSGSSASSSSTGASADLAVTGAFTPASAPAATPVTLDVVLADTGPSDAHDVTLSLTIPAALTVTSGPPGCAPSETGQTCAVGTLANGALTHLSFSLTSPADGSAATVSATVAADEGDTDATDNTASITLDSGCAKELTLDAVTVLADCIAGQTDGTLLATGSTRFSQGTAVGVPLVIDPAAHTISLQPGATGTLTAGGREVAAGALVVHTQPSTDAHSSLAGEPIDGVSHVDVALSGWPFLDDLSSTGGLYLLPGGEGGGALVVGKLQLPWWIPANLTAAISVQVDAAGKRAIRSAGGVDLPAINIPHTDWKLANVQLQFLDGGDVFKGTASFKTSVLDNTELQLTISHGKLQSFYLHYDGTGCSSCSATDPRLGKDFTIADLRYISVIGENLARIAYTHGAAAPVCAVAALAGSSCTPPQIVGQAEAGFYDNRILALLQIQYLLSGALHATGKVFFAPVWPPGLQAPHWGSSVSSLVSLAKQGFAIYTAHLDYYPPHHYDIGGTFNVVGDFLVGSAEIGFDPPHFTGEGGLTLQVPPESPVLGGHKIANVAALISDKAAAAEADFKVCALGYCLRTFLGVAYLWSGHFVFQEPIEDFRTVSAAAGGRSTSDATTGPLVVPAGEKLAAVQVRSSTGVPDVRLTSPDGSVSVSARTSSRLGNRTGALVSTSRALHEETFLLAEPKPGRWTVERLRGPAVASVMLGRGLEAPALEPRAADLPAHATTTRSIRLHWRTRNPWPRATVDLWAGTSRNGAGTTKIASGLPASGSATWKLTGLQTGRYYVWAILNRDGIPARSTYWRRSVDVVNSTAPPPPRTIRIRRSHGRVVVSWSAVRRAVVYSVVATPAKGKPVEVDTPRRQAVLRLEKGRRYVLTVQSIDSAEFRGAPSRRVRIRG
ncbi:MAG: choice-of-anchor Q domain-containing protein [Gaiellaceae bacterium]